MNFYEKIDLHFTQCKLCHHRYRQPKVLECMHSFCQICLEQLLENKNKVKTSSRARGLNSYYSKIWITCPVCIQVTMLPTGGVKRLSDDRLVMRLLEMLERTPTCQVCKGPNLSQRVFYQCLDCCKQLCVDCSQTHSITMVTIDHTLLPLDEMEKFRCPVHTSEYVRYYCLTCQMGICVVCTFSIDKSTKSESVKVNDHSDHDIVSFREGFRLSQMSVEEGLRECADKMGRLRRALDIAHHCEAELNQLKANIDATTKEFIQQVRAHRITLLLQLEKTIPPDVKEIISRKAELLSIVEDMETLCTAGKVVCQTPNGMSSSESFNSAAMLLLNRQKSLSDSEGPTISATEISSKLQNLCSFSIPSVDTGSFDKHPITFEKGHIELGKLQKIAPTQSVEQAEVKALRRHSENFTLENSRETEKSMINKTYQNVAIHCDLISPNLPNKLSEHAQIQRGNLIHCGTQTDSCCKSLITFNSISCQARPITLHQHIQVDNLKYQPLREFQPMESVGTQYDPPTRSITSFFRTKHMLKVKC